MLDARRSQLMDTDSGHTVKCPKYNNGHHVHWIPALKHFASSPRVLVIVEQPDITSGWFHATTVEGREDLGNWWTYDPVRLAGILAENKGTLMNVKDTSFSTNLWKKIEKP